MTGTLSGELEGLERTLGQGGAAEETRTFDARYLAGAVGLVEKPGNGEMRNALREFLRRGLPPEGDGFVGGSVVAVIGHDG